MTAFWAIVPCSLIEVDQHFRDVFLPLYKVLVENPKGKRPLGRLRYRWEDGIRMVLREIGWGGCRVDLVGSG
jgi:hypothetical protein